MEPGPVDNGQRRGQVCIQYEGEHLQIVNKPDADFACTITLIGQNRSVVFNKQWVQTCAYAPAASTKLQPAETTKDT